MAEAASTVCASPPLVLCIPTITDRFAGIHVVECPQCQAFLGAAVHMAYDRAEEMALQHRVHQVLRLLVVHVWVSSWLNVLGSAYSPEDSLPERAAFPDITQQPYREYAGAAA